MKIQRLRTLGVNLLASAIMAAGMLPLPARAADIVQFPLQEIWGNWNRLQLDQMMMRDDLEAMFRGAYNYRNFDTYESWPDFAQLTVPLDARCAQSAAKGATGTTNKDSPVQEQKDKAQAVLNKMGTAPSAGQNGIGATNLLAWYGSLRNETIVLANGSMTNSRLMTIVWEDGSASSVPVFRGSGHPESQGIQVGSQGLVDLQKPNGQGPTCTV